MNEAEIYLYVSVVLGVLLAISEALTKTPIASNGIFQLLYSFLKTLAKAMPIKKGGFARLRLLAAVALLSLSVLALQGCAGSNVAPRQPGEAIGAAAVALEVVVKSVVASSRAELISDEKFLQLFDNIREANRLLEIARKTHAIGDSVGAWAWVDQALAQIVAIRRGVPNGN